MEISTSRRASERLLGGGIGVRFLVIALAVMWSCAGNAWAQADVDAGAAAAASGAAPIAEAAAKPSVEARGSAREQNDDADSSDSPSLASRIMARIQIHGFVSEGGFISTANDYIGDSSRGSLKLFEAGINFSVTLTDQLRVGVQIVSRSVGYLSEEVPRFDWAIIDYRYRPWIGLRAGMIKTPFGLYNEYIGVDAARTALLPPQSVYPMRNRDVLISHTGFALYGSLSLGPVGGLDYQGWLGILTIPRSALELNGAELNSVNTRYTTGGQLFWRPPLEGLRVGGTYLRAVVDFNVTLAGGSTQELIAAGLVPPDYNGQLTIQQRPAAIWVTSAEYTRGDWLFAFEYSRWLKHQQTSLPSVIPSFDEDTERFYGMLTYRVSPYIELGSYYSVIYTDIDDRRGSGEQFKKRYYAHQRDLAATLRVDVNEYWLWKLEGHFIDGTADLSPSHNPDPTRYWGMFLLRTTVTF